MKAITVEPEKSGSARLEDVAEPDPRQGSVLVAAIAVGVCGTDVEIVEGKYGWSPPGEPRLVLGHESLGQVIDPGSSGLKEGDFIAGVVCLTGVGSGGRTSPLSTADVASDMVLRNNVVVGSVNANKRHWYKAGEALTRADRSWLTRLVTRRERPEDFNQALERKADDIKVVVQFAEVSS